MADLEIKNLRVSAGDREILKGLDIEVSKGEIHALMGPNGSGKSTLANVIMGHPGLEVTSGTICFKGEETSQAMPFSDDQLKAANNTVRELLKNAVSPGGEDLHFEFDPESLRLAEPNDEVFNRTIWGLAKVGEELYNEMLTSNGSAASRKVLDLVRTSKEETLQLAMLHQGQALFPWPLLYDWDLGDDPESVCRGDDCQCDTKPKGVCVKGFWGVRHRVEQMATQYTSADGAPVIATTPQKVRAALMPVLNTEWVKGGMVLLRELLADKFHEWPADQMLLENLRQSEQRPEIMAVMCHGRLQNGLVLAETVLLTADQKRELVNTKLIAQELKDPNHAWDKPHSLLLLLACGSGVARLDTATALTRKFLTLGAGGVVGTECIVSTGLSTRFAHDLVDSLHHGGPQQQGLSMGEAMRQFIHGLALEGCPLGFVFTYLGSADLRLPRPSTAAANTPLPL